MTARDGCADSGDLISGKELVGEGGDNCTRWVWWWWWLRARRIMAVVVVVKLAKATAATSLSRFSQTNPHVHCSRIEKSI